MYIHPQKRSSWHLYSIIIQNKTDTSATHMHYAQISNRTENSVQYDQK